ncbi:MAG: hypothetical protein WKF73_20425 [Nocardioidaceae bacterium]
MSEASNVWRVDSGGQEHEVELEHSTMTGKLVVKLDGKVLREDRMLLRKKPLEFEVDGHPAVVTAEFKYGGLAAGSSLHFDGRYVEPLRR